MCLCLEKEMLNHTCNDKVTKLNQKETLIQSKYSYLGILEKENQMHLIYVGYEFLIYA